MAIINGIEILTVNNTSLKHYLEKNNYCLSRVAVEKNGKIIPKIDYEHTLISDKDKIEIVHFVGGG